MKKTKIDWCDSTVNIVMGCPNNCEYCYARQLNKRFRWIKDWSKPQFFPDRIKQFECKKPQSVFVDSMSDVGCWDDEWLKALLDTVEKNKQHNYIILTKTSINRLVDRMVRLKEKTYSDLPVYIGKTITTQRQADDSPNLDNSTDFLSVEPLLEPIDLTRALYLTSAVIIGAETGNRKNKVVPQKEWIDRIVKKADEIGVKVFMKESLRTIMGDDFRQDELPWAIKK